MSAALIGNAGPLGRVLRIVDAYDRGELLDADLAAHYMDAMCWSTMAVRATAGAPA
jgi:hypothetical protein